MRDKPLILIILDGWGINPRSDANAIAAAALPTWDMLRATYPMTTLDASGLAVGLRPGLMGNSEVGHMNMGAGRVIWQEITRIDRAIDDGSFFRKPAFTGIVEHLRRTGGALHVLGLVSEGGVHSSEKHYFALADFARNQGIAAGRLFYHALLDGRDTPLNSGHGFVKALMAKLGNTGTVATVMGRYWAMDRDQRWDRVEKAWRAIVMGEGKRARHPLQAITEAYRAGETDEFISPIVMTDSRGEPVGGIRDGDAVIFFNFRADRAREISRALTEEPFTPFTRPVFPKILLATMTSYHEKFTHPVAFEPISLNNLFGSIVSERGLAQLRIAETEKYAHVTFFFSGGSDTPVKGEERILVPSPKVPTYDLQPEMSAGEVTERVLQSIRERRHDVTILNYANPDMVGHTGKIDAAIKAVEAVDGCLGRVISAINDAGGTALVTADHGNVEQMIDYATGAPHTYHTTFPVPFIVAGNDLRGATLRGSGSHKDIAPTMLRLLGIPQPREMEGESLIR